MRRFRGGGGGLLDTGCLLEGGGGGVIQTSYLKEGAYKIRDV